MEAPVDAASGAMVRFSLVDSVVPEDDEASESPASAAEERNWASLPHDILSVIFRKVAAIFVMKGAQWVCRPWRELSWEPQTWRVVDMTMHSDNSDDTCYLVEMAREVIARSNGMMEEFCARNFGDDRLMEYIAERTNGGLKRLRLVSCGHKISHLALIQLAKRSPLLEYLDVFSLLDFFGLVQSVGNACPHLKLFRLNCLFKEHDYVALYSTIFKHDVEAFGVANSMKELRHLGLVGSYLSNAALHAIFNNCQYLESLDIRCCYNIGINFDDSLRKKCATIKDLKLPAGTLPFDDDEYVTDEYLYKFFCGDVHSYYDIDDVNLDF